MAGSGHSLMTSINKCSKKYQSRLIAFKPANFGAKNDIISSDKKFIQECINDCDILHLKGDHPPKHYKRLDFSNKSIFQTVGGSNFRRRKEGLMDILATERYSLNDYKNVNLSGITPELTNIWIPHAMEVNHNYWILPTDKIVIGHSPTNRLKKGTDVILEALQKVDNIEVLLMEGLTNAEVIELKKKCHLFIDQIILDAYGMSAVECLTIGVPVIASRLDIKNCPVIKVDEPNVDCVLKCINFAIQELKNDLSKHTFDYAKKTHSYRAVCQKLEEFYNLKPKYFTMKKQRERVLIEYLPNNQGLPVGKIAKSIKSIAKELVDNGWAKYVEKEKEVKDEDLTLNDLRLKYPHVKANSKVKFLEQIK